jgi:hypothetical protein
LEQLQYDDGNTNIGTTPKNVLQQVELPTLNTSIEQQIEAPHASTTVVQAPMANDKVTHMQSIGSTNLVFTHSMNTLSMTMDSMVSPRINNAHLLTQDTLIETPNL